MCTLECGTANFCSIYKVFLFQGYEKTIYARLRQQKNVFAKFMSAYSLKIGKRVVSMRSEIFVSFFIAISLTQISLAADPSTTSPTSPPSTPANDAAKPPAILPVVAESATYYGGALGNYLISYINGDEWSAKYLLYRLLQGTHLATSTVAQYTESLMNSPYINIYGSTPDTTKKEGETKPEAEKKAE